MGGRLPKRRLSNLCSFHGLGSSPKELIRLAPHDVGPPPATYPAPISSSCTVGSRNFAGRYLRAEDPRESAGRTPENSSAGREIHPARDVTRGAAPVAMPARHCAPRSRRMVSRRKGLPFRSGRQDVATGGIALPSASI